MHYSNVAFGSSIHTKQGNRVGHSLPLTQYFHCTFLSTIIYLFWKKRPQQLSCTRLIRYRAQKRIITLLYSMWAKSWFTECTRFMELCLYREGITRLKGVKRTHKYIAYTNQRYAYKYFDFTGKRAIPRPAQVAKFKVDGFETFKIPSMPLRSWCEQDIWVFPRGGACLKNILGVNCWPCDQQHHGDNLITTVKRFRSLWQNKASVSPFTWWNIITNCMECNTFKNSP